MLKPNSGAFTVLLAGLAAMAPISTDIALPSYAATASALGTTQASVAVSLSLFMVGYAVGPLGLGSLPDIDLVPEIVSQAYAAAGLVALTCTALASTG